MIHTFKAGLSIFRIRVAEALQYRLAALAGASTGIFWGLIEIIVLTVFYKYADNRADSVNGMTLVQAVSYIWIGQALMGLQPMNIDGDILSKIVNGDIGVELCRPLDPYAHWFAKTAAGRLGNLWRMLFTVLGGLLMPQALRLGAPSSIPGMALFVCSVCGAFLLCASYGTLVAVVRIGVNWGDGPTYLFTLIGSLLSGAYLPLQLWPDFMQRFLSVQPFAGYLDIPARLYIGTLTPSQAAPALITQLIWILMFVVLGKLLMNRKLKGIIIQGG